MTSLADVANAIRAHTYRYASEDELQDLLATAVRYAGWAVEREERIDVGRIDLYCCRIPLGLRTVDRIGVEVKVDGSPGTVSRQLRRYATSDDLDGLVLVTNRVAHRSPATEINGMPFTIVNLARPA